MVYYSITFSPIKRFNPGRSITISRNVFFLCLLAVVVSPFLVYKILWIANSKTTRGVVGFIGKEYSGQIVRNYSVISFSADNGTIWFNGNDNDLFKPGALIPVRYAEANPKDARINNFVSLWGDTVVYGGIPTFVILIIFVHPLVVPRKSRLRLAFAKPFITVLQ